MALVRGFPAKHHEPVQAEDRKACIEADEAEPVEVAAGHVPGIGARNQHMD